SDLDKTIEAAEKDFQYYSPWRKLDPAARAQLIRKLADLLLRVVDYLAVKIFTLSIIHHLSTIEIYSNTKSIIWAGFLPDIVNIDVPVRTAHRAVFTHAGQLCFAASRIFVHSTLHDAFVSKSVELTKKRIVDDPFNSTTEQGP
ncbi:unnamed protein product, partial [Rotaria sordida]